MATNITNQWLDTWLTRFDDTNSSFVLDEEFSEIIKKDLTTTSYKIPIGYNGDGATWHEQHVDDLPVFDIALGFRSSSFSDVSSPYGQGFYVHTTGSGVDNSNPAYPAQFTTTSSRIYDYFASVLNDHEDFVFSNTKVDALAIISFRNRKLRNGFRLGTCQIKHNAGSASGFFVSDFYNGSNIHTSSLQGPYSLLIEKGNTSYNETILRNIDNTEDRIVGKVYKNYGIVLLDLVKLFIRDTVGNFQTAQSRDWTNWNTNWPIAAVVSSSYSWSLDRTKEALTHLRVVDNNTDARRVYFCKGNINEFNTSTNPSFYATGSRGEPTTVSLFAPTFTYVTSVGLYNDDNELMAIGKLNKPLKKDHTSELHITARISY